MAGKWLSAKDRNYLDLRLITWKDAIVNSNEIRIEYG